MDPRDPCPPLASTATLLRRVRSGDSAARDQLVERALPPLRRWARGRLPAVARGMSDTDDLVQTTLVKTLDRIEDLEPRAVGSFLAYMRRVLVNSVTDEIRASLRRPQGEPIAEGPGDAPVPSTSEADPDTVIAYERALETLAEGHRDAVVLRLEFGMTFPEIAAELGLPSADAARMRVSRALVEVADAMPR